MPSRTSAPAKAARSAASTSVQEGIPQEIFAEMCNLGWQDSLVAPAQLVEPDIPA